MKQAGTRARLEGGELAAPEALRPERDQRRVRGTGHRVFGNAMISSEHPARDVMLVTSRRHRDEIRARGQSGETAPDPAGGPRTRAQAERVAIAGPREGGAAGSRKTWQGQWK